MNATQTTSLITLSDDELKKISLSAAKENPDINSFNVGFALAEFCAKRIRKCTEHDLARISDAEPAFLPARDTPPSEACRLVQEEFHLELPLR